jgi:hypothetical protein
MKITDRRAEQASNTVGGTKTEYLELSPARWCERRIIEPPLGGEGVGLLISSEFYPADFVADASCVVTVITATNTRCAYAPCVIRSH